MDKATTLKYTTNGQKLTPKTNNELKGQVNLFTAMLNECCMGLRAADNNDRDTIQSLNELRLELIEGLEQAEVEHQTFRKELANKRHDAILFGDLDVVKELTF